MLDWTFELNNQPMSSLQHGVIAFPAFSGYEPYVNKRVFACMENVGAIPPGVYYILDRQSGGRLGLLYEILGIKNNWFSLYARDQKIDDEVFCNQVKRGNFRLHPKAGQGVSKGCITIDTQMDFYKLESLLRGTKTERIPGTNYVTYGTVLVK